MPLAHIAGTNEQIEIRKLFCIGRNYADHAREMKAAIPETPIFFLKPATAIVGDGGVVVRPHISNELHHEVELTVLIGKGGRNILPGSAFDHVAGYGVGLDMTLRDIQNEARKQGLPWTLAKGFDTSAPISSFVPGSAVADPHDLEIQLEVNGTPRQHSSTRNMIFPVDKLIAFISQFVSLERGDILFTGTPEGVSAVVPGDRLEARLSTPAGAALTSLRVSVQ